MFQTNATTGDLVRTSGSFVRVDGEQEIAQHVRTRLRLFRGECPFNLSLGMRYVGVILGKGTPPERIEGEIIETVIGTPGVVSVDNIKLDTVTSDRQLSVEYDATIDVDDARRRIPLHDKVDVQGGL